MDLILGHKDSIRAGGLELSFIEGVHMFTISTEIITTLLAAEIANHISHLNNVGISSAVTVNCGYFGNGIFVRRENKLNLWRPSNF